MGVAMSPEIRTALLMLGIIACVAFVVTTACRIITKIIFICVVVLLLNTTGVINVSQYLPQGFHIGNKVVEVLDYEEGSENQGDFGVDFDKSVNKTEIIDEESILESYNGGPLEWIKSTLGSLVNKTLK